MPLIHTKWLSTLKQFLGHIRLFELNECFWCSISYQQLNLIFIWTAFGLILWKIDLQIVKILSKYAFDYHLWWRYCWQLRGTAEILEWSKYNILNFFSVISFSFPIACMVLFAIMARKSSLKDLTMFFATLYKHELRIKKFIQNNYYDLFKSFY